MESPYSTTAQPTNPSLQASLRVGKTKVQRKHRSSLTAISSVQGFCSDATGKASVTATTSVLGPLRIRRFPAAGIQSEAALELSMEYSSTARLQHQDLEQARMPWDISFWPARLHNFLPLRLKKSPVISCCPSVRTYSTNWIKSVTSQHPLASFGLLHTSKTSDYKFQT